MGPVDVSNDYRDYGSGRENNNHTLMKTAIIGMTYGLIMWGTNWLELYTGVDYIVNPFVVAIFHMSAGYGLVRTFISDITN